MSCVTFRNKLVFYDELIGLRPTLKLEEHPLTAVRERLFNILAATLHIWRTCPPPQPENEPCRDDRDPYNMACCV